jgi:acylphosphatase
MLESWPRMIPLLAFIGLAPKGRVNVRLKGNLLMGPYQAYVERTIRGDSLRGWLLHQRLSIYETMEIEVEGPKYKLERLLEALKKGPAGAKLLGAEAQWKSYRGDLQEFRVRL